jgi:putative hemolysin
MALLIIVILIVLNGLFAMAEMAVVSARKTRLQHWAGEGNRKAAVALNLASEPDRFLPTIQIGITLISILAGAIGQASMAQGIEDRLKTIPALVPHSATIAFLIVVGALTYASLLLGELVPKRLALHNPERIASMLARPVDLLSRVAAPLVRVFAASSRLVLGLLGIRPSTKPTVTEEEIKLMLHQAREVGIFEEKEHEMIRELLKLADRRAGSIMIPRRDVVWLDLDQPPAEHQRTVIESHHSRFPVGRGSLDNVIGIVQAKDLLATILAGKPLDLPQLSRSPLFVPENVSALECIDIFKQNRIHLGLVVDEFGGIEGILTINDVLEDLVGGLPGAVEAEPLAIRRGDGSWLMDGRLPTDRLKHILNIAELPEESAYNTLAGFVLMQFGRIPTSGDHFEWRKLRFEVVDMDRNRIDKVLITIVAEPPG